MNQVLTIPHTEIDNVVDRAAYVEAQIVLLVKKGQLATIALGLYLAEAKKFSYYTQYGYTSFDNWVTNSPHLDFKVREAYFLMDVASNAQTWSVPDDLLCKHNFSCLKLIMAQPEDRAKSLLVGGPYKVTELRKMLANPDEEKTEWISMVVVMTREQKEVVQEAFRLASISSGLKEKNSLLEIICGDFIAGVTDHHERDHSKEDTEDEISQKEA